jgi:hypothetical protein
MTMTQKCPVLTVSSTFWMISLLMIGAASGVALAQTTDDSKKPTGDGVRKPPVSKAKAAKTPLEDLESLRQKLRSSDQADRKKAAEKVLEHGPAAKDAIPELIAILLDSEDRAWRVKQSSRLAVRRLRR